MKGEDLGANWGSVPASDDLGTEWGVAAAVTPSKNPRVAEQGGRAPPVSKRAKSPAKVDPAQEPRTSWVDALFPANAKAQREGAGIPAKVYATAKDALTLPGRSAFAQTQSLGELAGSRDIGKAMEVGRRAAADPVRSFEGVAANMPGVQKYLANPQQFAEMAADPLTIPGAILGASSMKPIAQGLLGTVAAYGRRQADARASGESVGAGIEGGEIIPALAGAGVAALPVAGGALQNTANSLFRKMVKPVRAEAEGLTGALSAGKLPELAGWSGTVGGAGEQFLRRLGKIGEQYPEVLAAADATAKKTGEKVSTFHAFDQARKSLIKEAKSRGVTLSPDELNAATNWLGDRIRLPNSEEGISAVLQKKRSWPANDILPSEAHRMKSSLYDVAFGKDADAAVPRAARINLAKTASKDTRDQLNKISPEYAALNREAAPLYGAEDAMARAAEVRGNNYHFGGLDVAGLGVPVLLRTPAASRAAWESGKAAKKLTPLAKRLAPILASPRDQTDLGRR